MFHMNYTNTEIYNVLYDFLLQTGPRASGKRTPPTRPAEPIQVRSPKSATAAPAITSANVNMNEARGSPMSVNTSAKDRNLDSPM